MEKQRHSVLLRTLWRQNKIFEIPNPDEADHFIEIDAGQDLEVICRKIIEFLN